MNGGGGTAGAPVVAADDPGALERAGAELAAGRLVAIPTETVYGIACLPLSAPLEQLLHAKGRGSEKGIALLVGSLAAADAFAHVPRRAHALGERFLPGPLTLVVEARAGTLPPLITGGRSTVAVRIPDHAFALALAASVGPLALTSANRSGEADARTADEVSDALGGSLALIVDDGVVAGGRPSTVVSVDRDGRLGLLREGALPFALVDRAVGG